MTNLESTKKKILFIINPKSGVSNKKLIENQIVKYIDEKEFVYDFVYTQYQRHAEELSKNAVDENYQIIVAVGGDGTVREVAKGLKSSETKLAIIPTGSGNGFAFHHKIPRNICKAVEIINKQKSIKCDTASLNEEFFVNVAGIGFDAQIAFEFANYKKRGFLSYLILTIKEFFKYKTSDYIINVDGKQYKKNAFLISFANASQFGNNAYISPEANVSDGMLDVCILKKFPFFSALNIAIRLFRKSINKSKYLEIIRGKEIVIKQENPIITHLDGEPFEFENELNIKINPASLNLIIP